VQYNACTIIRSALYYIHQQGKPNEKIKMAILKTLLIKANKHYDVEIINGLTLKFKQKKYKTAWVKYTYPNKKQLLSSLFFTAKNNYPKTPIYQS
jgi:hypothetical protein